MADRQTLLVELGTEELPPKALHELERSFAEGVAQGLRDAALTPGPVRAYATPRRLAVLIEDVPLRQADREIERRGPPVKVAFDADGRPTRAALAFAESCGVPIDAIGRSETAKGAWLSYTATETGQPLRHTPGFPPVPTGQLVPAERSIPISTPPPDIPESVVRLPKE